MAQTKRAYAAPTLKTYGDLQNITMGIFGSAPDVPPFNNVNCVTAILTGTGGTFQLTCATGLVLS